MTRAILLATLLAAAGCGDSSTTERSDYLCRCTGITCGGTPSCPATFFISPSDTTPEAAQNLAMGVCQQIPGVISCQCTCQTCAGAACGWLF